MVDECPHGHPDAIGCTWCDTCEHLSATGVDQSEGDDKVWRCDACWRLYRTVTENGITRMLFGVIPSDLRTGSGDPKGGQQ
jgi:hypothetical protein